MSHDTHHGHSKENKTIISFKNSFWLIVILVGLFVAALNFIQVESHGEGEGEEAHHTEATHEGHGGAAHHEAEKAGEKAEAGHEAAPAAEAEHKEAEHKEAAHHEGH